MFDSSHSKILAKNSIVEKQSKTYEVQNIVITRDVQNTMEPNLI